MGKWNNRYYLPRNRQRRYEYEYPPYDDIDSYSSGVGDSRVPSWEIDYCKSVRIPWNKVVASKYLIGFYPTVQDWDDSASKESFEKAKARYWEMTNGIPGHSPLPDPDMFIDAIDWNPYIDPKQMEDLDLQFFNPDEEHKWGTSNKDIGCEQKGNSGNAWERGKEQESGNIIFGWGQWGSSSVKLQNDHTWEQNNKHEQDSGDVTNGWGEKSGKHVQGYEDGWGEKRGKHVQDSGDVTNGWGEKSGKNVRDSGDVNNGWGEKSGKHVQDSGDVNSGWGQCVNSVKLENDNPWEQSGIQIVGSSNENAWRSVNESWGCSNGNEFWGRSNRNECWGRKNGNESWERSNGNAKRNFSNGRWQNNNGNRSRGRRDSEFQGNGSSFWSCKRYREDGKSFTGESSIQHSTNYKSSRY